MFNVQRHKKSCELCGGIYKKLDIIYNFPNIGLKHYILSLNIQFYKTTYINEEASERVTNIESSPVWDILGIYWNKLAYITKSYPS